MSLAIKDVENLQQQLHNVQQANVELQSTNKQLQQTLEESKQQSATTKLNDSDESIGNSPQSSSSGGGGVKFGVLKRKIKDLEETNTSLQNEIEQLKQQQTTGIVQVKFTISQNITLFNEDLPHGGIEDFLSIRIGARVKDQKFLKKGV